MGHHGTILGRPEAMLGHLETILGHLGGSLGGLGGFWGQEIEQIATAGSLYHPGEAKSVILIAFFAVSAEPRRGSRRLLTISISRPDAQGRGVGGR